MANYLLAYRGGAMPDTPKAQQKVMEEWMNWFGTLGESVVDGGAPFGPASTIASSGAVKDGGAAGLTGYSVVSASSLSDAVSKAKGCPALTNGGSVEVYESMPMG
jgi:hypothetical protein